MPPLTPNSRIIGDIESDGGLLASIGSHTKDDEFSPHHEKEKTKLFMPSPLSITETSLVLHSHFRHEWVTTEGQVSIPEDCFVNRVTG